MKLNELLDTEYEVDVLGISVNTATLKPGDLFLAIQGVGADRHDFLEEAAAKGAVAAVVSKDVDLSIPAVKVDDVNAITDRLFQKFYANVQNELELFAVTGTDGKTSVSTIIWQLLGQSQAINAGTNGLLFRDQRHTSFNTTPDSAELYAALRAYKDLGAQQAVMEFSSEAQHFGRLNQLEFDVVGLTNITSEHLNTHGTRKNYINAKTDIFLKHLKLGAPAVLNADDDSFSEVSDALSEYGVPIFTYGSQNDTDLQVESYIADMSGTRIKLRLHNDQLRETNGEVLEIDSPLLGDFNVENLACAILMLLVRGHHFAEFAENIAKINIAGRLDMVSLGQDFYVMVDYAHTPNGITRLLGFVDEMPGVNRIITVIGQAGERDKSKRAVVGKIVAEGSDLSVFTEDDPKHEPVHETIADITSELEQRHKWVEIPARGEAIRYAVSQAREGDLVMVLGKGVDDYMKIGVEKVPYNDLEEVTAALEERLHSGAEAEGNEHK